MTTNTTLASLESIDLRVLAAVTGGAGAPQQAPQQAQAAEGQPAPSGGHGGFFAGLDSFLSFLQSPNFGKIVGGIQGLLETFMGGSGGAREAGPQPTQQGQ